MAVTRGDVGLLFGLAGFLLGAAAFWHAFRVQERQTVVDDVLRHDGEMIETLVNEKTALSDSLAEANKRISSLRKELTDGMNDVSLLRRRLDRLDGGVVVPAEPEKR